MASVKRVFSDKAPDQFSNPDARAAAVKQTRTFPAGSNGVPHSYMRITYDGVKAKRLKAALAAKQTNSGPRQAAAPMAGTGLGG